ncbi:N-acetyltransferase [Planosporangium thailandense]|uniref:N-acetyltransferase n=1 Tax=Planosporangium thailandense TaxID=765197 RepID=A0ABX0Y5I5_9ACTN|nr:GNAT family N-acetyltransferase [Planosporangium thailandense]NJC73603.1 N-acetyltransferase [Planosporangium thailandense]
MSIVHNPELSRYEVRIDGRVAGFTQYRRAPRTVDFTHTEVYPEFEGQGLGSKLAAGALDAVRAGGDRAVASCPFISTYIKRHPEYSDLVAAPDRSAGTNSARVSSAN